MKERMNVKAREGDEVISKRERCLSLTSMYTCVYLLKSRLYFRLKDAGALLGLKLPSFIQPRSYNYAEYSQSYIILHKREKKK